MQNMATLVRHSGILVGRSPQLLAQRYNSLSSLLLTEQREAMLAAAAGSKQSYHESGEPAPSKHPRTQPLDSHFLNPLMIFVAGEHAFPE